MARRRVLRPRVRAREAARTAHEPDPPGLRHRGTRGLDRTREPGRGNPADPGAPRPVRVRRHLHRRPLRLRDLRSKVRTWWDLDELTELYAGFLRHYRPILDAASSGGTTPREAFRTYIPMLTQWRRLPYRDPGLPLSLLPPGWNGVTAGLLFDELNMTLGAPAREHALAVIHGRG
ncbi:PaaX family transcriptional regulator C-terminal domain-containing protein [Streptomyces sp. FXJ1.4098]|nr:PaaX family transcriptional regulator C-terminal domain-containing protein [Streptomyces sp. FXJ1.4098]